MKQQKIKLIVGLGNWPKQYSKTRHNVGYMMIDSYCRKYHIDLKEEKFEGLFELIKSDRHSNKFIIAKPLTLMNLSGKFIEKIINYFKIDIEDVLIICDDINLKVGDIRIRPSGSSGGQNGLKNIISILGTENFKRLRIGIGRPISKSELVNYVLGEFSDSDKNKIQENSNIVNSIIDDFINDVDFGKIMNQYN